MTAPLSMKCLLQLPRNFIEQKIKIRPFSQGFPPELQLRDAQFWDKESLALLHWKNNVNRAWMICGGTESSTS